MNRKRSSFSSNIILHFLAIPLSVVAPTDGGARNHTPKSGGIVCRRRHSAACCLTSCSHASCWFPTRRLLLLTGLISHSLGTLFPDYSPPISEKVDMLHSCKANELVWTQQSGTHDQLDVLFYTRSTLVLLLSVCISCWWGSVSSLCPASRTSSGLFTEPILVCMYYMIIIICYTL